jgi:hypothetical protein
MPLASLTGTLTSRLQSGAASSAQLEQALGVSQSAVSRALRTLAEEGRIARIGSTRGARYALRRQIDRAGSSWPLRQIDRTGAVHDLGHLHALAANQFFLELSPDGRARRFAWEGVTSHLPYFLQDQRPGGFLGRAVPRRHPELELPQRVVDWNDDHYLRYLTARGSDTVSDLVLGDEALDHSIGLQTRVAAVPAQDRAERFPQLASQVMEGGLPGSSAHGEHPKFTVLLKDESGTRHQLVKFSPPADTPVGQRWSDLLVAEHLAHEAIRSAGIAAATSRIFRFRNQTYLEMERFDRAGLGGRIGVTSLFAIDGTFYRKLDNWIAAAVRLLRDNRISNTTLETTRLVATFGALIANTDRHFGNLALYDDYTGRFELAPIYDMLPMLFAPQHDQIVARVFQPPEPTSETLRAWSRARALAESYWRTVSQDSRISGEFRAIAAACLSTLEALPRRGAFT